VTECVIIRWISRQAFERKLWQTLRYINTQIILLKSSINIIVTQSSINVKFYWSYISESQSAWRFFHSAPVAERKDSRPLGGMCSGQFTRITMSVYYSKSYFASYNEKYLSREGDWGIPSGLKKRRGPLGLVLVSTYVAKATSQLPCFISFNPSTFRTSTSKQFLCTSFSNTMLWCKEINDEIALYMR